jgi:hypothetical protein
MNRRAVVLGVGDIAEEHLDDVKFLRLWRRAGHHDATNFQSGREHEGSLSVDGLGCVICSWSDPIRTTFASALPFLRGERIDAIQAKWHLPDRWTDW